MNTWAFLISLSRCGAKEEGGSVRLKNGRNQTSKSRHCLIGSYLWTELNGDQGEGWVGLILERRKSKHLDLEARENRASSKQNARVERVQYIKVRTFLNISIFFSHFSAFFSVP